jgi:hypothetical protein
MADRASFHRGQAAQHRPGHLFVGAMRDIS